MAYTPELSMASSRTLRRIAWALDIPMTTAMEKVFECLPRVLDRNKICETCRDKTMCHECLFSTHSKGRR